MEEEPGIDPGGIADCRVRWWSDDHAPVSVHALTLLSRRFSGQLKSLSYVHVLKPVL